MFQKIAKHRANDASNDVHRPPLLVNGEGVKLGLLSSYFEPTGQIFTANIIGQFLLSSGIPFPI